MLRIAVPLFVYVFSTAGLCSGILAQQQQLQTPDFGEGEFEKVSHKMEYLFQLEWKGENVVLSRRWFTREKINPDDKNLERVGQENLKRFRVALIERGVPQELAESLAENWRNLSFTFESGVTKLFSNISDRWLGSSGGGKRRRLSIADKNFSGVALLKNENFHFVFTEKKTSKRRFEFQDNNRGAIRFEFKYGKIFVLLIQSENGITQLILIQGDKANEYSAESFAQFIKNHPEPTQKILFPLFKRLSIRLPLDKFDERAVAAVVNKLREEQTDDYQTLKNLVSELDSDSFATRKNAHQKIAALCRALPTTVQKPIQGAFWIRKYSKDDSLSPEARRRLQEIISDVAENEMDKFVSDNGLLDSLEYLVSLLNSVGADEEQLIAERLEKLTGQSHGDDAAAWKNWLKKK